MKNVIFSGSSDDEEKNETKGEEKNENDDTLIILNSPTHSRRKRIRTPSSEPAKVVTYQYSDNSSAPQSPERSSPRKRRRRKTNPDPDNKENTTEQNTESTIDKTNEVKEPKIDVDTKKEYTKQHENTEKQEYEGFQIKQQEKPKMPMNQTEITINKNEDTLKQKEIPNDNEKSPSKPLKLEQNLEISKSSSINSSKYSNSDNSNDLNDEEEKLSENTKDDDLITYFITREKSLHILGKQYKFQISDGEKVLYSSKFKAKSNFIPISCKETCHIKNSEDHVAYIVTGNCFCDFSLREKSQTGYELMTIRFFPLEKMRIKTRKCIATFFSQDQNGQTKIIRLLSKTPEKAQNGTLKFNFGHKPYIQSLKNLLLYDCIDKLPAIRIRKLPADSIEVDAKQDIDPLHLFSLVIADCLCNTTSF